MKNNLFCLFLFFSGVGQQLSASHELGGYISYRNDTLNKYSIFVHVYRDCRGVNLNNAPSATLTLDFLGSSGSSIGYVTNVKLNRISISDLSIVQQGRKLPCAPLDSNGSGVGFEMHVFKAIVDLDSAPYRSYFLNSNVYSILFSYVRTHYSTGTPPPDFYLESGLNLREANGNLIGLPNSSPEILMHNSPFQCCNQGRYLKFMMHDTLEFDSIKYNLTPLKNGTTNYYSYSSPFSYQYPITPYCVPPTTIKCFPNPKTQPPRGFYFDTLNANTFFTPVNCSEVAPISFKATEYKSINGKPIEIGFIKYYYTLIVSNVCGYNNTPSISSPSYNYIFAIDKKNTIDLYSQDGAFTPYQSSDTTDFFFPNAPSGSSFAREKPYYKYGNGKFEWTPGEEWFGRTLKLVAAVKDRPSGAHPGYNAEIITIKFRGQYSDYRIYTFLDKNKNGKKDSLEPILPNVSLGILNSNKKTVYKSSDANGMLQVPVFSGFKVLKFITGSKWFFNINPDTLKYYGKDTAFTEYLPLHSYPFITGNAFYDVKVNCQKDTQDFSASNVRVFSQNSSVRSSSTGQFVLYIDTAKTNISLNYENISDTCPKNLTLKNIHLPLDTFIDVGNVPLKPFFDIASGLNTGLARRGNYLTYKITVYNYSYASLNKFIGTNYPEIHFMYPTALKYIKAGGAIKIDSTKGIITYKCRNINAEDTINFNGSFYIDPALFSTGDLLNFTIQLDSNFKDSNIANNSLYRKVRIIGPLDPNSKTLLTGDSQTANEIANYQIDFQNFGTDTAFQVVVVDSLSTIFDPSSIALTESSHTCKMSLTAGVLTFTFPDAKLTDTITSKQNSKGFVTFSAGIKQNISKSLQISNQASIFFDYEKPVVTVETNLNIIPNTEIKLAKSSYCHGDTIEYQYRNNFMSASTKCQLWIVRDTGIYPKLILLETFIHQPTKNWIKHKVILPDTLKTGNYRLQLVPQMSGIKGFNESSGILKFERQLPQWHLTPALCDNETIKIEFLSGNKGNILMNDSLFFSNVKSADFRANSALHKCNVQATTSQNCRWVDSAIVLVHPTPKIIVQTPEFTCFNSPIVLKTSREYFYTIYQNQKLVYSHLKDSVFNFQPNSAKNELKILIETDYTCRDSTSKTVIQRAKPVFQSQVPDSICKGDSLPIKLVGNYFFTVKQDGYSLLENVDSGKYNLPYFNHDPIYIIAKDSFACSSTDSAILKGIENDTLELFSTKTNICSNDSIRLQIKGIPQANLFVNDKYYSPMKAGLEKTLNLTAGNYKFQVSQKSTLGCDYRSIPIHATVYSLPLKPTLITSGDTLMTKEFGRFIWYKNGSITNANDTLPYLVPTQNGFYQVKIRNIWGCESISDSFNFSLSALKSLSLPDLIIWPNPANDKLYIKSLNPLTKVSVYNSAGILVLKQANAEKNSIIDISSLPSSVYFLVFEDDQSRRNSIPFIKTGN